VSQSIALLLYLPSMLLLPVKLHRTTDHSFENQANHSPKICAVKIGIVNDAGKTGHGNAVFHLAAGIFARNSRNASARIERRRENMSQSILMFAGIG
jgi:hypothetical protein